MKNKPTRSFLKITPNERTKALQVQYRLARFPNRSGEAGPGARPHNGAPAFLIRRRRALSASLTLEAALALPLFLFAMYILILPMRMLRTSRSMQTACEEVCQAAAQGVYVIRSGTSAAEALPGAPGAAETIARLAGLSSGGGETRDSASESAEHLRGYLTGNALGAYAAQRARAAAGDGYAEHVLSLRSSCLSDGETITLTLDYDYRLPFTVFGLGSIHQSVTASRRAWLGADPSWDPSKAPEPAEEEDPIVYVGRDSTRYHRTASCHYLSNSMTPVPFSTVGLQRNRFGKHYAPCSRCAKGVTGGTVYILDGGTSYHADMNCSALAAYARAVRLSTVSHLGKCSYCW